jgi:hypothetical protein
MKYRDYFIYYSLDGYYIQCDNRIVLRGIDTIKRAKANIDCLYSK